MDRASKFRVVTRSIFFLLGALLSGKEGKPEFSALAWFTVLVIGFVAIAALDSIESRR